MHAHCWGNTALGVAILAFAFLPLSNFAFASPKASRMSLPRSLATQGAPVFLADIIASILPKRNRPALRHHPGVEVDLALEADGDHALIAVAAFRCTAYNCAPDHVGERKGGFLPAAISFAGGVEADLGTLRRIDCIKADAFAADLDGVSVDDRCGTLDRRGALGAHDRYKKSDCQ